MKTRPSVEIDRPDGAGRSIDARHAGRRPATPNAAALPPDGVDTRATMPWWASGGRVALWLDVAVKVATVALLVLAVLFPTWPQFQGKAFVGRAIGYPVALMVLPVIWWLVGRRKVPFPAAVDVLLGLPFLIDMAGNAANLYDSVTWWDDANHFVNWGLHTAGIGLLLRATGLASPILFGLGVAWASTTAIVWELAEYIAFVPNSPEAATAYEDTLGDLALGMAGGTLAAALVGWWAARRA